MGDLHYEACDRRHAGSELDKRERMQNLVVRVHKTVAQVAKKHGLLLAVDKEESMVLRGGEGRKTQRSVMAEKVKWLCVILDEHLDFRQYWKYRIVKAQSLLEALGGVSNLRWGMNPVSWRAVYSGMIRSAASCGMGIGWRGQRECIEEMSLLQNSAIHKMMGAVKGSSAEKVKAITAVQGL